MPFGSKKKINVLLTFFYNHSLSFSRSFAYSVVEGKPGEEKTFYVVAFLYKSLLICLKRFSGCSYNMWHFISDSNWKCHMEVFPALSHPETVIFSLFQILTDWNMKTKIIGNKFCSVKTFHSVTLVRDVIFTVGPNVLQSFDRPNSCSARQTKWNEKISASSTAHVIKV